MGSIDLLRGRRGYNGDILRSCDGLRHKKETRQSICKTKPEDPFYMTRGRWACEDGPGDRWRAMVVTAVSRRTPISSPRTLSCRASHGPGTPPRPPLPRRP
ncbi:hypothetical protein VTK73DRAFT_1877 [Phialemonium thermophilum]|uniref:Uncharacterized protein n=1 Tax=Phialemonium thermophilum TaxID=223376 RepID=A0ABR3VSU1_9PEZI